MVHAEDAHVVTVDASDDGRGNDLVLVL